MFFLCLPCPKQEEKLKQSGHWSVLLGPLSQNHYWLFLDLRLGRNRSYLILKKKKRKIMARVRGLCNFYAWPLHIQSHTVVIHDKSSEAVCPCIHSPLQPYFKRQSWVNYITRVCYFTLTLCAPLICSFHFSPLIIKCASSPWTYSNLLLFPPPHSLTLSLPFPTVETTRLWHNPVEARDVSRWNYLRTCDERKDWLEDGTADLPCHPSSKAPSNHVDGLTYLIMLKTEQTISHQST